MRTTRNLAAGEDAYSQLVEHKAADFAEVLLFVLERLYFEDRPLHDALLTHLADRQASAEPTDRFEIALIYDADVWDERVLERIEAMGGEVTPLRVHSARITNLARLVDQAYDAVCLDVVISQDCDDVDDSTPAGP